MHKTAKQEFQKQNLRLVSFLNGINYFDLFSVILTMENILFMMCRNLTTQRKMY